MDPYSLKRDNRKKFQDKQRLKNRHATPSDRKYRILNRQEQNNEKGSNDEGEEEEEEKALPSNESRYNEDITMIFENPQDIERNHNANQVLRSILQKKVEKENEQTEENKLEPSILKGSITTKSLQSMDVQDLNQILRKGDSRTLTPTSQTSREKQTVIKQSPSPQLSKQTKPSHSNVPQDLATAQDFLDDLI